MMGCEAQLWRQLLQQGYYNDHEYLNFLPMIPEYYADKLATDEVSSFPWDYKNESYFLKFKDENAKILKGTMISMIIGSTIELLVFSTSKKVALSSSSDHWGTIQQYNVHLFNTTCHTVIDDWEFLQTQNNIPM